MSRRVRGSEGARGRGSEGARERASASGNVFTRSVHDESDQRALPPGDAIPPSGGVLWREQRVVDPARAGDARD